jgi:hypothetical protein
MRGERGKKTVSRTPLKNTPLISNNFRPLPDFALAVEELAWLSSRHRTLDGQLQFRALPSSALLGDFGERIEEV